MKSFLFKFTFILFVSHNAYASELQKQLEALRSKYVIPGMSAAIYVNDSLVAHAVSGIRKVGHPTLISKEDKFHLGSCTKSITATLAATFVEEGKLNWKDKVSDLLEHLNIHPELKEVTFEMLLSHQSGIRPNPDQETYLKLSQLETQIGREESTKIYLSQAPQFKVGKYEYSNLGYIIAGHILERIAERSWEELIQERIFEPLNMETCGFGPTSQATEDIPTQPWGHYLQEFSIKPIQHDNAPFYGPAANIHCSMNDWTKLLAVHMNGYKQRATFLNQESFNQLHKISSSPESQYTYGGWFLGKREWAQGAVLQHTGTNTYNFATVWIAPETETILISTSNRGTASGFSATSDAISSMIQLFINKPKKD